MQDRGYGLLRILLLGTSVNKPSFCTFWTKIHREFIFPRYSTYVGSPAAAHTGILHAPVPTAVGFKQIGRRHTVLPRTQKEVKDDA